MKREYKVVVAHPGRQHSFRLASALKKNGLLHKYITTIYNKDNSRGLQLLRKVLSEDNIKRANGRKNTDLADVDVVQFCILNGYIEVLLSRIDKSHEIYRQFQRYNARRFGMKVAMYAINNQADAVIMYDTNALKCFEILQKKAPAIKRIMDCSIIARPYMYEIYNAEIVKSGHDDLKRENRYLWRTKRRNESQKEINLTQYFLAGSDFVKESLIQCGAYSDSIYVIPYGANIQSGINRESINEKRTIHFLFVGQVNYRKGIPYILEAMSSFTKFQADLTIVGAYNKEEWFIEQYKDKENIYFTGLVTKDKMQQIYENADVFVIDSFAEGMTQVGIEAMACGLPVIASHNSGLSSLVDDGKNGFLIQPGNAHILIDKIKFFLDNPEKIYEFGKKAKIKSQNFTWEMYEAKAQETVNKILVGDVYK